MREESTNGQGSGVRGNAVPASSLAPRPLTLAPAFTLIELLVVMGIILLAMLIALPALRALTGSRSAAAAQNVIAPMIARARADAIGLQKIAGVLFYEDMSKQRIFLAEVIQTDPPLNNTVYSNQVTYLDLAPNRDTLTLPSGVDVQMLNDPTAWPSQGSGGSYTDSERYMGFNAWPLPNPPAPTGPAIGGVILFDGSGRAVTKQYGFNLLNTGPVVGAQQTYTPTSINMLLYPPSGQPPANTMITDPNTPVPWAAPPVLLPISQLGFVLFDRDTFLNTQFSGIAYTDADQQALATGVEQNKEQWLDTNATPILVNRYNGTLTRAE